MWVDAVHHEGGDGPRGVVFAGIAGALEVVEDLLVDVAEVLALGEIIEVDAADLVDHLTHELPGFHVIVGILEDLANDPSAVAGFACRREFLERRKKFGVDERKQLFAGNALRVGGPGAPLVFLRNRRAIAVLHQLKLLILVIDDLEEKHPAELGDALGIAIDTDILAHDVLDGLDGITDGHGFMFFSDFLRS